MDALNLPSPSIRLQFPSQIENRFQEDYHEKTISTSRLAIFLGILLIASFGLLDRITAPESHSTIWTIRFGIVTPALALLLSLTFVPRIMRWTQWIVTAAGLVSTIGITVMGAVTRPNEAAFSTYYVGVLLALMAGYTFARLRFWYATMVGIITLLVYEFMALGFQNVMNVPMGREIFFNNNFFLISANLIGMFACYFMERYARLDYLQRRQIEEEKAKSETMLQQEAAEALRASEARFRTVVEISTEGIVLVDMEGRYLYTSPAFERITGYTQAELLGELFMPQIYPDDLPIVMDAFTRLVAGLETTAEAEYRFVRKDGQVRFISGVGQVLSNGQLVAFISDISERKQAEDGLRRQNKYLTTLHDTTLDLINRLETPGLLKTIVARAASLLNAQEAYIFLVEPDEASLAAETGVGSIFTQRGRFHVQRGEGVGGRVWESGKLLAIDNYQSWEHRIAAPEFDTFQAVVGAPLTSGERTVGVLTLARTSSANPFRADQLDFLSQFAHLVSVALDNARLYTAAQTEVMERRRTEEAFRAIVEGTASATGNEFFRSLVSHLATALGVNHAFVAETTGEPPARVRTLAFYSNGGVVPNIEYALPGTPCEDVVAGGVCYYPQDVRAQFPQDLDLVKLSAESYMGLPIVDASGKTLGHVAVLDNLPMQDDTRRQNILKIFAARAGAELERQHAEEKLRDSEEHYRSLIENSSDGIAIFDRQGIFQYASPGLTRIVGWEASELLGQTWHTFAHPDDLAYTRGIFHQLFENPGQVIIHESRFKHKDGSWRVMEIVGKLHLNGLVVTNSRDITDRKQAEEKLRQLNEELEQRVEERTTELRESEERFRTIAQASPIPIIISRISDGTILYANPSLADLIRLPLHQVIGQKTPNFYYDPADRARILNEVKTKGFIRDFEFRGRRADDTDFWAAITIQPITYDGNQVLLAGVYEITELKQIQNELQQAKEVAETANKAKSTFLANMSHEIRTPMNAVIGMTSLLLETSLNVKQRDFVETIRSSGDVLLAIINDILDFSKIEAGKMELVNRPLDLRSSIENSLDLLAPRIAEKNLNVAYYMEKDVPNAIQGDSTRLRQILVNLVGNAVKFTEKGEIVIRVDARRAEEGQNSTPPYYELHFQVHDTGIGIPMDKQDQLFQSFSQVDASSTRVYGGTGLGLAISKRLSEMMGGGMWVESPGIPGEGATFHFTIQAEQASLPSPKVSRGYVAELTGKKILLVDDHQTNLQILQLQTEAWGMMPQTARSSEQALALLDQGISFDIAILDSQMPGMNGFELAKKIRERETSRGSGVKRLPLILLASVLDSGFDSVNLFDALLTKPIKPSNLFDILMTAFDAADASKIRYPRQDKDSVFGNVELLANQYPLRILLAEDVVVNQKFALLALERMGYRADVVANGQEAMEAILRQPYDVVLMDINMPVIDGYEASRRIHELWKNGGRPFDISRPRIIAMTANALQGDRELALEAGADDYISKPVYLNELQMVLARAGHARKSQTGVSMSQNEEAKLNQVYLQSLLSLPDGKSLIAAYLEESPTMIEQLRNAVQDRNTRELKDAAHALKGSSLYVGAEDVAELAKMVEHAGRANTFEGVEHVLSQLEKEYSNVAAALTGILNS